MLRRCVGILAFGPVTTHHQRRITALPMSAQGRVFELTDRAGHVAAVVLKAAKGGALISNIQREWAVGQKVTSLQDEKGYLPGFMKVGGVMPD